MACPFPVRGACATLVRMPEFDDGLTETALPSPSTSNTAGSDIVVETDVLVVGSDLGKEQAMKVGGKYQALRETAPCGWSAERPQVLVRASFGT